MRGDDGDLARNRRRARELVEIVQQAQRELQELTGETFPGVLGSDRIANLAPGAQVQLTQSERELAAALQAALDALPAQVALLDQAGIIRTVNQSWRRFALANGLRDTSFGVGASYLLVCHVAQGSDASLAGAAEAGIRAVLAGERNVFALEYPCDAPNQKRWFELRVAPVEGLSRGAVVMHIDITKRKLDEDALRQSEARLRAILESEPECVKLVAPDGRVLEINAAGARMTELDDSESTLGWSVFDIIHPDDLAEYRALHERVARGGAGQLQFRLVGFKGTERWMETHSVPLKDGEGELSSVLSITRDITDRRIALARLEALQRQTSSVLKSIGEGIHGLDAEGRIVFENPAAAAMLGWAEGELVGRHCHDSVHHHRSDGRPYPASECPILQTIRDGLVRHVHDEVFFCKDGTPFAVDYVCSPMLDVHGTVTGAVVGFRDVSERKRLEQHVLRAQRLESIGTLAGGIAHDLNNVLSPILFSVDLLKLEERSPERLRDIDMIEACARRGVDMVRQVLTFARGLPGHHVPTDLRTLTRETEKVIRDTFPKNIEVKLSVDYDVRIVSADPTQMTQVLMNLCLNARDAMPYGGLLSIELKNVALHEGRGSIFPLANAPAYVEWSVTDTGCGMSRDVIERAFEPFFTTKEAGKGTGLGLSTTHAIVKDHGGFIDVLSCPNRGSKFSVYLPALEAAQPDGTPSESPQHLPHGNGELVLVIDDEQSIREMLERTLGRFGYRVLTAANGAEGVRLYRAHTDIAVVIVDSAMPLMDGPTTVSNLKAENPAVRIIASSGFEWTGEGATDNAAQYFVAKPYRAETILNILKAALSD